MKTPTQNSKSKQTVVQITILVFALLILPITLLLVNNRQRTTSGPAQAAPGNAALSIQPVTANYDINQSGTLNVRIDPNGEDVASTELYINFDPTIIKIDSITPGNFFTDPQAQGQVGEPQVIINNVSNGQIHYAVGFPLGSNYSSNQFGFVANINYTALSNGTSPVTIIATGNPSSMVADINAANVIDSDNISNGQIIVGTTATPTPDPTNPNFTLTNLNPSTPITVGDSFTVDLNLSTGGQNVSGIDAHIIYDNNAVELTDVVTSGFNNGFSSYPAPSSPYTDENQAGKVIVSANIGTSSAPTPVNGTGITVARLTFNATAAASNTTLSFDFAAGDRNDSNIVRYETSNQSDPTDILASVNGTSFAINQSSAPTSTPTPVGQPTASPTPVGQPTSSPTPTIVPNAQTMTVFVNLEGRTRADANKVVDLSFAYRPHGTNTTATTITTTTQTGGEAIINIIPNNYVMLISAPGYLPKRFPSPQDLQNSIGIIQGTSTLDLRPYGALLGGEFNNDGEINEVDYSLYYLTRYGTTDALVDLDGSGEVNTLDYSIMKNNWNITRDNL